MLGGGERERERELTMANLASPQAIRMRLQYVMISGMV